MKVHFLDVGQEEYGDAVLCELGRTTVLIDGAHPGDQVSSPGHSSIPEQLESLLNRPRPIAIDLLVVTHAHRDHIGCLPSLVASGTLTARWALVADPSLGWGRALGEDAVGAPVDPALAALREEIPSPDTDERVLAQLLTDAANLEQRYTQMLSGLAAAGTRVVRYGRDSLRPLVNAFRRVGLRILGPSQEQLALCADRIALAMQDVATRLEEIDAADVTQSDVERYMRLLHSPADAIDASDRPGPAINLQSVVTRFSTGGVKLLFAGDMQFADPQTPGEALRRELDDLRRRITAEAPFDLVKLSHHGSDNAFSEDVLAELGTTPIYGICAGEDSTAHPNPRVLRLLDRERLRLQWVRTDRNGLSTIEFGRGEPRVRPAHGAPNDARPNVSDVRAPESETEGEEAQIRTEKEESGRGAEDQIEVLTRVRQGGRVTVTIDATGSRPAVEESPGAREPTDEPFQVGSGRRLPRLLVVTSAEKLATNVGAQEAERVLEAVRAQRSLTLYDRLPAGVSPEAARRAVSGELVRNEGLEGVLLLGGLDVAPAHRRDSLPPRLRRALGQTSDLDDFIVWSDEAYGDVDGDFMAELPVSRIPDGQSAELLYAALAAGDQPRGNTRQGVRNVARPFADAVFDLLPGGDPLLVSDPATPNAVSDLSSDHVYLMLHGSSLDSSRFWGEDAAGDLVEAVNLTNIPARAARVVFSGCCWGALTVEQPALRARTNSLPAPKPLGASLALSFLRAGATAFIGCTGVHYSPAPPGDYYGGPMHQAFFQALRAGHPPARALFEAKRTYVAGMPHGLTRPLQEAVEFKILNQFTCLGLGW